MMTRFTNAPTRTVTKAVHPGLVPYWNLAQRTGGVYLAPSEDWP